MLRNGDHGYGVVTKTLHWVTVAVLVVQAAVGYAMGGLLDDVEVLLDVHVVLGLTLVLLAVLRILWRRLTPLPPWAEGLSAGERRVESWLERVLLFLLLVVPATGLLLAFVDDDLLPLHVAGHVALYVTVALHVGLVLRHTVVRRERHLQRML